MENRIIITKYPYNYFRNQSNNDAFVFYQSDWNDYGYYITYEVYYYNQKSQERYVGEYRVYTHSIEEQDIDSYTKIKHISEQIWQDHGFDSNWIDVHLTIGFNDDYFSLAHHVDFYQNVYNILRDDDDYSAFLNKLRDLTITGPIDNIKKYEGVRHALLRNDGVTNSKDILKLDKKLKKLDECLNVGNYPFTDYFFNSIVKHREELEKIENNIVDSVRATIYSYALLNNLVDKYKNKTFKDTGFKVYKFLSSLLKSNIYPQLESDLDSCIDKNLKCIIDNVNCIREKLRFDIDDYDNFIHYTSLKTLKNLVYRKDEKNIYARLRLSNARQMNDPNEGYTFLDLIGIEKKELPVTDYEISSFYFASMSQTGEDKNLEDSLPMWKQYGDDAKGINLTYHSDYIKDLIDDINNGIGIYKVCYNANEDSLEEEIAQIKSAFDEIKKDDGDERQKYFSSALNLIDDIRYLFKKTDYSYENEYRIIKSYEGKENEIFTSDSSNSVIPGLYAYIDKELKYSKIKLGPKCDDIDFVAPYIKYVDPNIEVTQSEISYR
ncbi:DUF2971 domain-containing protein [Streptococcus constellatus]|uniref:DUF2971 domain-containing protein n=1 Tax=Streptococcus constellatus TaxID=76860 RepID=UPI00066E51DA|nr:DUF2971 domain-containing protein [Streptococcus constellatus]